MSLIHGSLVVSYSTSSYVVYAVTLLLIGWNGMEWNFGAWTLAFFAWQVDIPWQAKEHPESWI